MNDDSDLNTPWFRDLYELFSEHAGPGLYDAVLSGWVEKAQIAVSDFADFKHMGPWNRKSDVAQFRMWNLYALSRVNDFLLLPFQQDETRKWTYAQVTIDEYIRFFGEIGFSPFDSQRFSSFSHEIVEVRPAEDDDAPIAIEQTLWPGFMFGEMLLSRSGVIVSGGARHVVREVAENSTLYFTHRRLRRGTNDMSMGWGHNSQWRTSFRRDYQCEGRWFYNIDGHLSLNQELPPGEVDRDDLTHSERIELCRNRSFLTAKKKHDDLYPFDDRYEEPAV